MKKTTWFIISISLLALIYEFYVLMTGGTTISESIWNLNERTTTVSFCMGLLAGHFFWTK